MCINTNFLVYKKKTYCIYASIRLVVWKTFMNEKKNNSDIIPLTKMVLKNYKNPYKILSDIKNLIIYQLLI